MIMVQTFSSLKIINKNRILLDIFECQVLGDRGQLR